MTDEKTSPNVYAAPGSNLEQISRDEDLLRTLKRQQSVILGIVISFAGTIAILEVLARTVGYIPMFAFLIPGFVVGGLVKLLARPFTLVARLIPGLIVASIVFIYFSVSVFTLYSVFLPFLNLLITLALSRRLMSYEQESALYRRRLGK